MRSEKRPVRSKSKLQCLPVTWELPWPVPPTPSSVLTTPPFALGYSTNIYIHTYRHSRAQCNTISLSTGVRFYLLVAPTCNAPVLRFEFPLPTLALSKSPPVCSVGALFCTGVAVFVPSEGKFFFFYFHLSTFIQRVSNNRKSFQFCFS